METKVETLEMARGGGRIAVEVEYTPKTGRPVRMHHLKMKVKSADGCSPYVFVYQRATVGAPMEDGSPRDEFTCVADELDEDEIPVNEPDMERGVPYYRTDALELLFRNADQMHETAASILGSLALPE
jgi:hypothetical protein